MKRPMLQNARETLPLPQGSLSGIQRGLEGQDGNKEEIFLLSLALHVHVTPEPWGMEKLLQAGLSRHLFCPRCQSGEKQQVLALSFLFQPCCQPLPDCGHCSWLTSASSRVFSVSPLVILGETAIATLAWPLGRHGAGLLSVFLRVLHSIFLCLVEY